VWTGAELQSHTDWVETLSTIEIDAILAAVEGVRRRGLALYDVRREDFPLDPMQPRLERVMHELEDGRGLVVLRGLPVERMTESEIRCAYWGVGLHLGAPLSQSGKGDLLGEVRNLGVRLGTPGARGYRGNHALPYHTDRSDYVGLVCVRNAKSGGLSRIASAAAVHNEMLKRRPDLVEALYQPFYMSWQGDGPAGDKPYYVAPIFGMRDGKFSCHLAPSYIRAAQANFPEVPRITDVQLEAIAFIQPVAAELALTAPFELGDMQFLNNHVAFHGRSEFEDHDDPEQGRVLLRLWLSSPIGRALPEESVTLWGNVATGALRGGVPAKDGGWRDVITRGRSTDKVASA